MAFCWRANHGQLLVLTLILFPLIIKKKKTEVDPFLQYFWICTWSEDEHLLDVVENSILHFFNDNRDYSVSETSLLCFRWLALLYLSPTLSSAGVLASLHPNSKVGSHEELARSCRWAMSLNHSQFDKTDKKCFIFS